MAVKPFVLATAAIMLVPAFGRSTPGRAADATLTGIVTSAEEGIMEGVVVSARRADSTIRVSVVTDAQGRYNFPAGRLDPGHYQIAIRAIGYDLGGPSSADVAPGKSATANIMLKRTHNLAAQLTNADWMASLPESPQRKLVANCMTCHTVQRVVDSFHTADEFMALVPRMMRYGAMSRPHHPQIPPDRHPTSEPKDDVLRGFADYLASINRSGSGNREYALNPVPRPSGRATRVIMTEYELPRPDLTEPHDVMLDAEGTVWYSNFGELTIGKLDPKTGAVTEYALPLIKPDAPSGSLNLEFDPDGNPWVAMMYQKAVAKLDKKTGKVTAYPLPPEFDNPRVQIGMLDPRHSDVDGKVWFSEGGSRTFFRLDPISGRFEHIEPFKTVAKGAPHGAYGIASDRQNNLWFFDFADRNVGRTDKSGATLIYPVPTPASRPRRGHMDPNGRLAFAEFAADKVAVFDTRTEQVREWATPPNFAPYDAVLDKNEEIWSGGMNTDTVLRVDTKTGQSVAYLLPMQTNIRRVFVDNSTRPVTFWVGNNHHGNIVKLEPLD
jgi:streptogramin lyase